MDFNRQNVQQSASAPAPAHNQAESLTPHHGKSKKRDGFRLSKNPTGWGLLLIALVLIAFGLLWFFRVNGSNEISQVNKDEYQAVFLSNGQVYFGKLDTLNNDYAKITHIFYLQVNQTVQPKQNGDNQSQNQTPHLVKLGNELHGPEDAMIINRSQVLFWENLKPSGKVTQAIDRYYKNGGGSSESNSSTNSNTTGSTDTSTTPADNSSANSESTGTSNSSTTTNPSSSDTGSGSGSTAEQQSSTASKP